MRLPGGCCSLCASFSSKCATCECAGGTEVSRRQRCAPQEGSDARGGGPCARERSSQDVMGAPAAPMRAPRRISSAAPHLEASQDVVGTRRRRCVLRRVGQLAAVQKLVNRLVSPHHRLRGRQRRHARPHGPGELAPKHSMGIGAAARVLPAALHSTLKMTSRPPASHSEGGTGPRCQANSRPSRREGLAPPHPPILSAGAPRLVLRQCGGQRPPPSAPHERVCRLCKQRGARGWPGCGPGASPSDVYSPE